MNRVTKLLAGLAMVLQCPSFWAQDAPFLQYELQPMNINPATTGSELGVRWTTVSQSQMSTLSNVANQASALDCGIADGTLGLGLLFLDEQVGRNTLNNRSLLFMSSYGINLEEDRQLRVGATLGRVQKSVDWENLTSVNLIDPVQGFIYGTSDTQGKESVSVFSAGLGLAYSGGRIDAGVSALHLNEPNESLLVGEVSRLPMRLNAHAQYALPFFQTVVTSKEPKATEAGRSEGIATSDSTSAEQDVRLPKGDVIFHALYMRQGDFQTAVVGVKGQLNNGFRLGLSAWGYGDNRRQIAPTLGMAWPRIQVDYGYGMTSSDLTPATVGTHSLTLSVAFGNAYHVNRKMRKARGGDVESQVSKDQSVEE